MRRLLAFAVVAAAALAASAGAFAAGGPVPPIQGAQGVSLPGAPDRFVALPAGQDTVIEHRGAGETRSRPLRGSFGIAGAALDGSTTGLSGDGRTLVLPAVTIAFPPRNTELAVLDAPSLRPRGRIALAGFYAVDAISPSGQWLYLVHYPRRNDPLRYEVRAYDLRARRLLPRPIVDPREPGEKMAGMPMTRAMSPDQRWAYTLYQRAEGAPFIHALDTAGRTAHCIDLPGLGGGDASGLRLRVDGGRLIVESAAGPQAVIDTTTFTSRPPGPAVAALRRTSAPAAAEGDSPWLLALPLAALATAAVALRRRRARR